MTTASEAQAVEATDEPRAQESPPVAEPTPPTIKLSDLGGALTACDASLPEGWSTCITRELVARGYRIEAGDAEPKAAGPAAAAVTDMTEPSDAL